MGGRAGVAEVITCAGSDCGGAGFVCAGAMLSNSARAANSAKDAPDRWCEKVCMSLLIVVLLRLIFAGALWWRVRLLDSGFGRSFSFRQRTAGVFSLFVVLDGLGAHWPPL